MRNFSKVVYLFTVILLIFNCGGNKMKEEKITAGAQLLNTGDELFNSSKRTEALEIYKQAADSALGSGSNSDLTEAYSQIARCYLSLEQKEEGRPWLEKATATAADSEPSGWSRYLGVLGRYQWKDAAEKAKAVSPEATEAAATFKTMYEYCLANKLYNRAIDAANMVSITGSIDERVEWGLKGIKAAEDGNLSSWLAPLWNNLGWTYDDLGRYDESLKALEKARIFHYKKGDELSMLIADWSVGHALRMTGQLDSAMTVLTNVQKLAFLRKAESKSPENLEWIGYANRELGEIALTRGDKPRALSYFNTAYANLNEAGMKDWDAKGFEELSSKINELKINRK